MKNGVTLQGSGADLTTIDGSGNGHVVVFNLASGTYPALPSETVVVVLVILQEYWYLNLL